MYICSGILLTKQKKTHVHFITSYISAQIGKLLISQQYIRVIIFPIKPNAISQEMEIEVTANLKKRNFFYNNQNVHNTISIPAS